MGCIFVVVDGRVRGEMGLHLVGCDELIESTNRWRVNRGEEPLIVDVSSRI